MSKSDITAPFDPDTVIMRALNDCHGGDGDPEWYREDVESILRALRDAGYIVVQEVAHV